MATVSSLLPLYVWAARLRSLGTGGHPAHPLRTRCAVPALSIDDLVVDACDEVRALGTVDGGGDPEVETGDASAAAASAGAGGTEEACGGGKRRRRPARINAVPDRWCM